MGSQAIRTRTSKRRLTHAQKTASVRLGPVNITTASTRVSRSIGNEMRGV